MRALALRYFQDDGGVWHQPGNVEDFPPDDANRYAQAGAIRIIDTAMTSPPETRTEARIQTRRRKQ